MSTGEPSLTELGAALAGRYRIGGGKSPLGAPDVLIKRFGRQN
jgi:hypothetical protein